MNFERRYCLQASPKFNEKTQRERKQTKKATRQERKRHFNRKRGEKCWAPTLDRPTLLLCCCFAAALLLPCCCLAAALLLPCCCLAALLRPRLMTIPSRRRFSWCGFAWYSSTSAPENHRTKKTPPQHDMFQYTPKKQITIPKNPLPFGNRVVDQIVTGHGDVTSFRDVVLLLPATALFCPNSLDFECSFSPIVCRAWTIEPFLLDSLPLLRSRCPRALEICLSCLEILFLQVLLRKASLISSWSPLGIWIFHDVIEFAIIRRNIKIFSLFSCSVQPWLSIFPNLLTPRAANIFDYFDQCAGFFRQYELFVYPSHPLPPSPSASLSPLSPSFFSILSLVDARVRPTCNRKVRRESAQCATLRSRGPISHPTILHQKSATGVSSGTAATSPSWKRKILSRRGEPRLASNGL